MLQKILEALSSWNENKTHIIADCLVCGHQIKDKSRACMYINKESLAWDCKYCGARGSKYKLLELLGLKEDQKALTDCQYDDTKEVKELQISLNDLKRLSNQLSTSDKGKAYLESRKFNSVDAKAFKLGFCDIFEAITIPHIHDGYICGLKYRLLNPNGSKYIYAEGSSNIYPFNYKGLKEKVNPFILICEGEFD